MAIIAVYMLSIMILRGILLRLKVHSGFFVFIAGIGLWLIASLRSSDFGPDTPGYIVKYLLMSQQTINDVWLDVFDRDIKDPLFYFLAKLLSEIGVGPQVWLSILSLSFIGSFCWLVSRYSSEPLLSFIFLVCSEYLYFSFTGLRQTLALSFIIFSLYFLLQGRLLKFSLLVLIASAFHSSAIIFFLAIFLRSMRAHKFYLPVILGSFVVANMFGDYIRSAVAVMGWAGMDKYSDSHEVLNNSGFIIQFALFLLCLFYRQRVESLKQHYVLIYNLFFVGVIFQSMSVVIAEFFRVAMYFNIFSVVLLPAVVVSERRPIIKAALYAVFMIVLVGYFFWRSLFIGLFA